jgi:hypothetical protein
MSFDPKRLVAEVRALAAEKPDFVYTAIDFHSDADGGREKCTYVHGDDGGCIVGQAALRAGMPLDELREKDNDDEDTSVSVQFADYGLSADELLWLSKVQHAQDTNMPWGAAVDHADDAIQGVK